jgi:serine phosphatase RsbU (regulator of sigma subunit)
MDKIARKFGWLFLIFFSLCQSGLHAQTGVALHGLDTLSGKNEVPLVRGWYYAPGDDTLRAAKGYNDSKWDTVSTTLPLGSIAGNAFNGNGWFRVYVTIDSSCIGKPLGISVNHNGASEIYVDGIKAYSFGKVGKNASEEERFSSHYEPGIISFPAIHNVIAVRYSNHKAAQQTIYYGNKEIGFSFSFCSIAYRQFLTHQVDMANGFFWLTLFGIMCSLSLVHFFLFLFFKENKANLIYCVFSVIYAYLFFDFYTSSVLRDPDVCNFDAYILDSIISALLLSLYALINSIFRKKLDTWFWVVFSTGLAYFTISLIKFTFPDNFKGYNYLAGLFFTLVFLSIVIIIIRAMIKKMNGATILGSGVLIFILTVSVYFLRALINGNLSFSANTIPVIILLALFFLSIPISMSLYLAREFAEKEKEKQRIMEGQKGLLEIQVAERTSEVIRQKNEIEEKSKEITDSIQYAKRLQQAILPPLAQIREYFPNSFFLYIPKDIVAGDFYWMHIEADEIFIAAGDCTGHGVPGALVSVVCSNALNRTVKEFGLRDTGKILDKVRDLVLETFEKSGEEIKDGMDISLLRIPKNKMEVQWSGANNPLWLVRGKELIEIRPDKQPIGKSEDRMPFTSHLLPISTGDILYLITDGYADQFSREDKKIMKKNFKELLLSIKDRPMPEQGKFLEEFHNSWKGEMEQTDDITVIGLQL